LPGGEEFGALAWIFRRVLGSEERIERRESVFRLAQKLAPDIARYAVKVFGERLAANLLALLDAAGQAIHHLVGQLVRRVAATAAEEFDELRAHQLILLARALNVCIKQGEQFAEGDFIDDPVYFANG
jgi:hypothetical protein